MITLNYWAPKSNPAMARIYVNGCREAQGKVFLALARNGITVNSETGPDPNLVAELDAALQNLGIAISLSDTHKAKQLWAELAAYSTAPKAVLQPRQHDADGMQARASSVGPISTLHNLDITTIKVHKPMHIQVDHREPDQLVQLLRQAQNTIVEVVSLPLGDILIDDAIVIERKRVPEDFEASIVDELRLHNQSERIKHRTDLIGVVILEGDVFGARQRMTVQQISGALTFLGVIQGMNVFPSIDVVHTAYLAIKLGGHFASGLDNPISLRKDKPQALFSARKYVLEGIPMVSAGIAERLLEQFGSITAVANASVEQLMNVSGIGQQRAEKIYECLHE